MVNCPTGHFPSRSLCYDILVGGQQESALTIAITQVRKFEVTMLWPE